jgi:large subunit ribosomal protein L21
MYAIVEIAGQQFKVEEGKKIFVHKLDLKEGDKISFDQVLLVDDEGKITVGEPLVKEAFVEGQVINQVKGDKVIVFKKKRKKGYRVKNGHRQQFTQVEIISINGKRTKPVKPAKKEAAPAAEEIVKEEPVEKKKPVSKKTVSKKADEKKQPAKKVSEKKPAAKKTAEKKSTKGKA